MARRIKEEPTNENKLIIDKYISLREDKDKSLGTLDNDRFAIERLAVFLNKNLAEATEQDLRNYFKTVKAKSTKNLFGIQVIMFYRWLFKLEGKKRPENMIWFEFITQDQKDRKSDPEGVKKFFITPEEYKNILEACRDKYGMWEAIFETYYLSGARLSEVQSMTIEDVKIKNDNVSVRLRNSKSKPRDVPLCKYPELLIRWLGNHPDRNNKKAPLWICLANKSFGTKITPRGISGKLWLLKKGIDIKESISMHCFRKTRATIMFNERSKDGGLVYSDSHLALFFGWKPHTVVERRQQYDLTTQEDLKNLIFENNNSTIETYDIIKQQKERLENEYQKKMEKATKEIDELKDTVETLMAHYKELTGNGV